MNRIEPYLLPCMRHKFIPLSEREQSSAIIQHEDNIFNEQLAEWRKLFGNIS